jgi:hypothetical protein
MIANIDEQQTRRWVDRAPNSIPMLKCPQERHLEMVKWSYV